MSLDIQYLMESLSEVESKIKLSELMVYLVVNTKEESIVYEDYSSFSLTTEYYSDEELNQIIISLRKIDVMVQLFEGENKFISKILNNQINTIHKNILVINSAQSGTGPGRKSLIPSFCKLNKLCFTGSNAYVVSLCRNKYHVNKLLEIHDISVPKSWLYENGTWLNLSNPPSGKEVIAKPIYESASVGITNSSRFKYSHDKTAYIHQVSSDTNQPIIIQEFIKGYEIEIPILKIANRIITLPPVGLKIDNNTFLNESFLDYDLIYNDQYEFYLFEDILHNEANSLPLNLIETLQTEAVKVYQILGMSGLCRIDFRIKENGDFYITDVSTNPHLIQHSSYNFAFRQLGLNTEDVYKSLICSAFFE